MELIKGSNSQSGQESFVLHMLDQKQNGTYLEIGAWDGIHLSNTYLLETKYGWKGIALDIVDEFVNRYNSKRANPCLLRDALTTDFMELLDEYDYPSTIDYLQLDIEPAENTFNCLIRIPFDKFKFRVITFEHDLYASSLNLEFKNRAHSFLTNLGYLRVADNIMNEGNPFEDWYILPDELPKKYSQIFQSNVEYKELFEPASHAE